MYATQSFLTVSAIAVVFYYSLFILVKFSIFINAIITKSCKAIKLKKVNDFAKFLAGANYNRLYKKAKEQKLVTKKIRKDQLCFILAQNILYGRELFT
ncbi:hypothetical protein Sta7437_4976 (plasmid) [Stanieria cyanosphaera PCC 7437]|uniref:Uncharacterized protein n=1 Tax=Stanieria cyanosphaera (strain ATCC 29371 / PCC 7437) TaxID=111780 RepID=K9Y1W0_STAC7|nr:hypothetical protein [Stanieria cyanosphaera]AFZ38396.1 hypothetical protein Sta7437_4976 [Stanieria cyanosphaera PCC 7437]